MKRLFIILVISSAVLMAQSQSAASLGLGLNYNAMARGSAALNWNPALLDFGREYDTDLSFVSFTTVTGNNSFSWDEVDYYFEKDKILTDQEKKDFMDIIKDDGLSLYSDTYVNLFSMAYQNFGFSINTVSKEYARLPKDLFNLMFMPTELGKKYDFSGLDISGYAATVVSFAYAYPFNIAGIKVSTGLQGNFYVGLGTAITTYSNVYVLQGEDGSFNSIYDVEGKIAGPGGFGYSFDLGVATQMLDERLDLSLSIKNLLGTIGWKNDAKVYRQFGKIDSLNLSQLINGDYPKTDTSYVIDGFSTPLPVYMNLGAAFHLSKKLTFTANWRQGFNTAFGNTYTPMVGSGVEYFVTGVIPLRGGITVGGNAGTLITLGSGLHFGGFHFDASFGMSRGMLPRQSTGLIGALSFRVII